MTFPAAVPEIPVISIDKAAAYYVDVLGFSLDWGDEQGGIAGISRGDCRLFLTNPSFREPYGNMGPVLFWLNLDTKGDVDQLLENGRRVRRRSFQSPKIGLGSCASSWPPI